MKTNKNDWCWYESKELFPWFAWNIEGRKRICSKLPEMLWSILCQKAILEFNPGKVNFLPSDFLFKHILDLFVILHTITSFIDLMCVIARAHTSTSATNMCHFCLWHLLSETMEWRKWKHQTSNWLFDHFYLVFVNLFLKVH